MAVLTMDYFSDCLQRCVTFRAILPNDVVGENIEEKKKPLKTLVLLHGYTQNCSEWINYSEIVSLAGNYHLCVILPSGENSFYLDGEETGRKFGTFIGEELLEYVRRTLPVSNKREDSFIGGMSMGGFGAIHTALQFPENFSKLFAFSSALIHNEVMAMKPGYGNEIANYEYYKLAFGDPTQLGQSDNNPEVLLTKRIQEKIKLPEIYMTCGTEDFLIEKNRAFEEFLNSKQIEHTYIEATGAHNFKFWNAQLEPALQWLCK